MDKQEFVIRFEDLSPAEASVEAQRLQETLRDASRDIDVKLRRQRGETMDMGATLVLVLGTPAIIVAARGIAAWLGERGKRPGRLVVERIGSGGTVERFSFEGDSADAAKVAEALRSPGAGASNI
jgi:hypothetical protein